MAEGVAVFAQFAIYYYYYIPAFGVSIDFINLFFFGDHSLRVPLWGGDGQVDGWVDGGGWGECTLTNTFCGFLERWYTGSFWHRMRAHLALYIQHGAT